MANTKVPIELSSTPGIVDNSTATAITIDGTGAATFSGDVRIGENLDLAELSVRNAGTPSKRQLYIGSSSNGTSLEITAAGALNVGGSATFSGNVGIGTSLPYSKLSVMDSSNSVLGQAITLGLNNDYRYTFGRSPTTGFLDFTGVNAAGAQFIGYTFNGNVGIGTTTPAYQLTLSSNPSFWEAGLQTEVVGGNQVLKIVSDAFGGGGRTGNIEFHVNSVSASPAVKIDASGNLGIGLDGGYKLDVLTTVGNVVSARFTTTATSATEYGAIIVLTNDPNDTTRYFLEGEGGGNARFRIYSNGNMVNQNNSYTGISDEKLKENIVDAGSQWDDIKALRVRKYSFKEENASEPTQIGVIAQEVEAAGMSGLVYETADQDTAEDGSFVDTGEVTKTMKYSILYMKAVKALQEAMERIESLETRIEALEGA